MNVLLTSAGRRVALVRAFRRELATLHPGGRVIGADASPWSAGSHAADAAVGLPPCDHPGYLRALLDLVRREAIRVLVPLIDPELGILARHREELLSLGCHAVVSDAAAIELTRHKGRSARRFAELGLRAPRVFDLEELEHPAALPYPVFVKPAAGSASADALRIDGPEEFRFWMPRVRDPVVQTFEQGREYTVDVFADLGGRVRCAVPRQRWETRAGEISKGCTDRNERIMAASRRLVEGLGGCRGCVTLQCFDPGPGEEPIFFEANLRFGGGFPLAYAAGANYPRWILEMCAGTPVPDFDGWRDGLVMLRYDDALFVAAGGAAP
jgi:carbamoyl-phosphate synthase large subunit